MRYQTALLYLLSLSQLTNSETSNQTNNSSHALVHIDANQEFDQQNEFESLLSSTSNRNLARAAAYHGEFTPAEVQRALQYFNDERRSVARYQGGSNLIELKINWNLTAALQKFIALGGADWGYEDAVPPRTVPGYNHYLQFRNLKYNSTFLNITKKYSGLYELVRDNDMELSHDTFKSLPGKALQIVRLRVNQRFCFKYSNCKNVEPLTYLNYIPCGTYPNISTLKKSCWWWWWYYPRIVEARAKEFAWVKLHRAGRFVVEKAQNDAWLFVTILNGIQERTNNIPYDIGGACTKCPPEFSACNAGLCISGPTGSPSAAPTTLEPTITPSEAPENAPTQTLRPTRAPRRSIG